MICTVTIDFKLTGIKVESSETYLLKLEKNLSLGSVSKLLTFFVKIRFKHMPISQAFLYLQENKKNIFLKLHHFLLRMPKIIEIG